MLSRSLSFFRRRVGVETQQGNDWPCSALDSSSQSHSNMANTIVTLHFPLPNNTTQIIVQPPACIMSASPYAVNYAYPAAQYSLATGLPLTSIATHRHHLLTHSLSAQSTQKQPEPRETAPDAEQMTVEPQFGGRDTTCTLYSLIGVFFKNDPLFQC